MVSKIQHKALVTGASRGIGASIASVFESLGIDVITPTRQELDLSKPESVEKYIESHKDSGIDIIVNNAGINILNDLASLQGLDWELMIQINLTAPMQLIRGFTPYMKSVAWGRIVNISSIFSLVTKEKRSAYSVTKSGLNALTRTAAVELAPYGVLVNSVCPGYVETELTSANNSPTELEQIAISIPIQRLAKPEEIANLVAFLCSKKNTYLTGQTIVIDGGFTCK